MMGIVSVADHVLNNLTALTRNWLKDLAQYNA
jgi:hypothetical protein